jgi:hypothetical protein
VLRKLSLAAIAPALMAAACSGPRVDVLSTTASPTQTPPASTAPPPTRVTVSGRVAAMSGSCPTLTFAVSDTTVTTTAATTVRGGTCAQIVNGVVVDATGTRQADRSIAATAIVIRASSSR